jgi:serine/threonine protein kinase
MAADASRCPSPAELQRLLGEQLADADRTAVEAHVQSCSPCQERLERMVAPAAPLFAPPAGAPPPGPEPDAAFLDRLRRLPPPATRTGDHAGPPAAGDSPDAHVPPQLGPYLILGRLGRGGMGVVYRARHRELDKVVALKVLSADRVDEAAVARFRNEMKAAGRLGHPNIVTALDAGRVGGSYYLAMDYVDGADLSALVERLGPLPVPDACELIRQAAVGLQHACECGLAHRDVKPSNLMLARGGVVKVLDLGLARPLSDLPAPERLTATGVLLGTADYLAPEQIDRAHTADARADVYGLGGALYFLLTGSPPFGDRPSWLEKLRAHR